MMYRCNDCGIRMVDPNPEQTDYCPVCLIDLEEATHFNSPVADLRGDFR